ncbi:hypothetical protein DZC78_06095 [Olleya aquimaris]|uniref:Lipocalin-like domain-containing protein n=1 Tax=Olleya sediminilitoris TaxID=2795739 RepID=A0ABS1WP64_9FLAO|nr:hypothetical protein [Olleya sediminilitoris]AXO79974.1 hypothetical protein DZC78_06095 [Olleya aquimaris]MBL7560890.1 hypothetical protein [Olleya sediminilitoris]
MKIGKLSLLMVLSLVFLTSCNNDDDSTQPETLNGIWNLSKVWGGLQGINIDYNQGEVKWDFNLNNNTLTVENNLVTTGPEYIYAGLESGTYDIEIIQSGETETLYIDNNERGVLILTENNLKIDDGLAADGFIRELKR